MKDEMDQIRERRDVIIGKMMDGENRYMRLQTFHRVVEALSRNADPILIMDQLLSVIDEQELKIRDLLLNGIPKIEIHVDKMPEL